MVELPLWVVIIFSLSWIVLAGMAAALEGKVQRQEEDIDLLEKIAMIREKTDD